MFGLLSIEEVRRTPGLQLTASGTNAKISTYFFFKDTIILMMDEIIVKKRFIEDMLTFKILTELIWIKVKSVLPKCIVFNDKSRK